MGGGFSGRRKKEREREKIRISYTVVVDFGGFECWGGGCKIGGWWTYSVFWERDEGLSCLVACEMCFFVWF